MSRARSAAYRARLRQLRADTRASLSRDGFVVLKAQLSDTLLTQALFLARKYIGRHGGRGIANAVGQDDVGASNRRQCRLKRPVGDWKFLDEAIQQCLIRHGLREVARRISNGDHQRIHPLRRTTRNMLFNTGPVDAQRLHTDSFICDAARSLYGEEADLAIAPMSVVLALEPYRLNVVAGMRMTRVPVPALSAVSTLHVPPASVVAFLGDLVHSGAAFAHPGECTTLRLHVSPPSAALDTLEKLQRYAPQITKAELAERSFEVGEFSFTPIDLPEHATDSEVACA